MPMPQQLYLNQAMDPRLARKDAEAIHCRIGLRRVFLCGFSLGREVGEMRRQGVTVD